MKDQHILSVLGFFILMLFFALMTISNPALNLWRGVSFLHFTFWTLGDAHIPWVTDPYWTCSGVNLVTVLVSIKSTHFPLRALCRHHLSEGVRQSQVLIITNAPFKLGCGVISAPCKLPQPWIIEGVWSRLISIFLGTFDSCTAGHHPDFTEKGFALPLTHTLTLLLFISPNGGRWGHA